MPINISCQKQLIADDPLLLSSIQLIVHTAILPVPILLIINYRAVSLNPLSTPPHSHTPHSL